MSSNLNNVEVLVLRAQADLAARAADLHVRTDMERFVAFCQPIIERFLRKLGVPKAELADCGQDVWVSLVDGLPNYDPSRSRFLDWLHGICRHKAADAARKRTRGGSVALSLADVCDCGQEPCDQDSGPCEKVSEKRTQNCSGSLTDKASTREYAWLETGHAAKNPRIPDNGNRCARWLVRWSCSAHRRGVHPGSDSRKPGELVFEPIRA